jgi:hypothetical protein
MKVWGRMAKHAAVAFLAGAALSACSTLDFRVEKTNFPPPAYPETSFAVFSDPHLFLPELGIGQPAFEKIKYAAGKMFEYSQSLLNTVTEKIIAAKPRFVIVPGDLSKDGEEAVHLAFATAMEKFAAAGIPVYVIPGNHDVNNPDAVKYEGDRAINVASVTPERFAAIYEKCGYGAAIDRDPHSLAYLAEPEPGLWLLALDSCRWDLGLGEGREHVGGSVTRERLDWIRKILERARGEHKAVLAVMHHGVVEHFPGQKKQFPDYVVEDNDAFSRMLAGYGVRAVFTGHFHSQNIAGAWWDDGGRRSSPPGKSFIYDIETGSLVTYPCAYRLVEIGADQVMRVRSFRIDSIPEMPAGFAAFALDYSRRGMISFIVGALAGCGISKEEAERIAAPITDAAIAEFAGDPHFTGTEMYPTQNLSFLGGIALSLKKDVIEGMWRGNPPHADNDIDINLVDGTYKKAEEAALSLSGAKRSAPVRHRPTQ